MIVTLDKAMNMLGERMVLNTQMLKQARRQRRTEYAEIPCVPMANELVGEEALHKFRCHILVSSDFAYWERFQFKLIVRRLGGQSEITPEAFSFKVITLVDDDPQGEEPAKELSVDITDYLWAQHDSWIDGDVSSNYYPTELISDEDSDIEDFYDILNAACVMWNEASQSGDDTKSAQANRILTSGTKVIEMEWANDEDCEVFFIPYAKYSLVNR